MRRECWKIYEAGLRHLWLGFKVGLCDPEVVYMEEKAGCSEAFFRGTV